MFRRSVDNSTRKLGWVSYHDERSRNYPIRALTAGLPRPEQMYWRGPFFRLDQGQEGACVGFAWTNEILSKPVSSNVPRPLNDFALKFYKEAQKLDDWPGEDYEGTSVLAGAKQAQKLGYITGYRWAFGIEDVLDALAFTGPVVIGIPWYNDMYSTLPGGLVKVGGKLVGGHAITLTGYGNRKFPGGLTLDVVRWRNSWGRTYGVRGDGYIRVTDLANLLKQDGEACVPTGRLPL